MTTATEAKVIIDGPGTYLNKIGGKIVILRKNYSDTCWVGVSIDHMCHCPFKSTGESLQAGIADIVSKVSDGIDV